MGGESYSVDRPGSPAESLGYWPCSRGADVDAVLGSLSSSSWARRAYRDRLACVRSAIEDVIAAPDPGGGVARALGLGSNELAPHAERLAPLLETDELVGAAGEGTFLCAPDWSELFEGFAPAFRALVAGRAVCLLSSSPLPALADRLGDALEAAGVPSGSLAVLHDSGRDALRCALESGGFGGASVGADARLAELCARWTRSSVRGRRAPFGAGVVALPAERLALEVRDLSRASRVLEMDDPDGPWLAEMAFGRSVLGGQLARRVGRVRCAPEVFSSLTTRLLEALEAPEDTGNVQAGPLYVDPRVHGELERSRQLGLDEGATLIHERSGPGSGSPRRQADASLGRLVFTNVEPGMRLAQPPRPAPLLLLGRAERHQAPHEPPEGATAS